MKKFFFLFLMALFCLPAFTQSYQGKWSKDSQVVPKKLSLTTARITRDTNDDSFNAYFSYDVRLVLGKANDVYHLTYSKQISVIKTEAGEKALEEELDKELASYETFLSSKPKQIVAFMDDDRIRFLAQRDEVYGKIYYPGEVLWATTEE